jgi:hypothetical protein
MYVLQTKSKLIWDKRAYVWPNLESQPELMTQSEMARTELKRHFPGWQRPRWNRAIMQYFFQPPPVYYSGCFLGPGAYVDLKAAYATIYRKLHLDMRFPREIKNPGRPETSLDPVAEVLWNEKSARNAVVGIIRSRDAVVQTGQTIKKIYPDNPYLQPHIWLQIQAILHEIANRSIKLGGIYVATDGYIFPMWSEWQRFVSDLERWGFTYELKMGLVDIIGWGAYLVDGIKATEPYQTRPNVSEKPLNGLSPKFKTTKNLDWWREL